MALGDSLDRRGSYEHTSFTFLGYTFRPRLSKNLVLQGWINYYGRFYKSMLGSPLGLGVTYR